MSIIAIYISLFFQFVAAVIAISMVKKTKFNASWILISSGFILMVFSRILDLFPIIYPEYDDRLEIFQRYLTLLISLLFVIGVFLVSKIFKFLRRLDVLRSETEKKVLSAIIRTEEKERQHFAKELHDGLGPLLSVIKMLVSALEIKDESNEKIKTGLKQAVDEAVVSIRDISSNISPHILNNFGLHSAIESFIKRLKQSESLDIVYTSNIGDKRFSYNVEVIMYRVVCELINNTLRHAKASRITIDINLESNTLFLEYSDNGIGFDMDRIYNKSGMGMENMSHRLSSANGDIKISSALGKGMMANAFIKI